jgi:hypothetical protein
MVTHIPNGVGIPLDFLELFAEAKVGARGECPGVSLLDRICRAFSDSLHFG